jgi:hypothetical protein
MTESAEHYRFTRGKREPFPLTPRELCHMDQGLLSSAENFFEEHPEISCQTRKEVMETLKYDVWGSCNREVREELSRFHFKNTLKKYVKNNLAQFFDPGRLTRLLVYFYNYDDPEPHKTWLKNLEENINNIRDNGFDVAIVSSSSDSRLLVLGDHGFEKSFDTKVYIREQDDPDIIKAYEDVDDLNKPFVLSFHMQTGAPDSTTSSGGFMTVSFKDLNQKGDEVLAQVESYIGLDGSFGFAGPDDDHYFWCP